MSAACLIGRRVKLTVPPDALPRQISTRLSPAQLREGPTGVVIGSEGWGESQELILLLDGFHLAYPFRLGNLQPL